MGANDALDVSKLRVGEGSTGIACGSCGFPVALTARYCSACGQKLPVADSSAEPTNSWLTIPQHEVDLIQGERRVVTVLMADIKDSTSFVTMRDVERASILLDRATLTMVGAIHRFRGLVSQNLGDGVMALFGAPVATEDHAAQACRAALFMIDAVAALNRHQDDDRKIVIRIGIDTGEAITRVLRSDWTLHYSAVGIPTHVATRLQQRADSGTAFISERTRAAAHRDIVAELIGDEMLKGIPDPVRVHAVRQLPSAAALAKSEAKRYQTAFVGRRDELAVLDQLGAMTSAGRGGVVAITGQAGIGKSRLLYEYRRHLADSALYIVQVRADPLAGRSAGHVIRSAMAALLRLDMRPFEVTAAQIETMARDILTDNPTFRTALLAWFDLSTPDYWAELSATARAERMIESACALIARSAPLLLVIEDVQHIDALSRSVLEHLFNRAPRARLSLVMTVREPTDLPDIAPGKRHEMHLEALEAGAAAQLLGGLLGTETSQTPFATRVLAHTQGHPLFIEETVRELETRGLLQKHLDGFVLAPSSSDALPLSKNIQSVIASRVDRVGRGPRSVLRMAAILGQTFERSTLERFLGQDSPNDAIERLLQAGLLQESRQASQTVLKFTHDLIWEVVYGGIVSSQRITLHRHALIVFDALPASADHLAALAYHAMRGEVWETAYRNWATLAERAMLRGATDDALSAIEQANTALHALGVNQDTVRKQVDLTLLEVNAIFFRSDVTRMAHVLRRALQLARRHGDQRAECRILSRRASQHWICGDLRKARQVASLALRGARALDDVDLIVNCSYRMGILSIAMGYYGSARRYLEEAIRRIPHARRYDYFGNTVIATCATRAALARVLAELGEFDTGKRWAADAIALASAVQHQTSVVYVMQEVALLDLRAGRYATAVRRLDEARASAEDLRPNFLLTAVDVLRGYALVLESDGARGIDDLERAVDTRLEERNVPHLAQHMGFLADAYARTGHVERAFAWGERALAQAEETAERADALWIRFSLAKLQRRNDPQAAIDRLREIRDTAKRWRMRSLAEECTREIAMKREMGHIPSSPVTPVYKGQLVTS